MRPGQGREARKRRERCGDDSAVMDLGGGGFLQIPKQAEKAVRALSLPKACQWPTSK